MDALTSYKTSLELGQKSENTIRSYLKDVSKLLEFFGISTKDEVKNLSREDIESFYNSQSGLTANSMKALVRNLMAFFNWLDESGSHAFFSVKFGGNRYPKVENKAKEILTDDEAIRLIQAGANSQERFMLALMLFTALRRGAIRRIKMGDIENCEISNIREKGGKIRKTYMNELLCTMFEVFKAQRDTDSEYVFYSTRGEKSDNGMLSGETINNRVQAAMKRAGISKKITAHRLRATRITQIIQKKGIQAAQLIAGHSNITTTKLYDGSNEDFVREILLG